VPKFLEEELKREYGANSKIPYMVMNKSAQCEATKKTAKGREMERKHRLDERSAARIIGSGG